MKILDIKVLDGPNFWSNFRKKLIVLKLDLEKFANIYSNQIINFNENLIQLIPSLEEHRCFSQDKGGLLQKLKEGTLLGHVVEHIALELQWLAGMNCGFGRTRQAYGSIYYVLFSYEFVKSGIYAAKAAIEIVEALVDNKIPSLTKYFECLQKFKQEEKIDPNIQFMILEAKNRDIPVLLLNNESLIILGYGCHQRMVRMTESSRNFIRANDRRLIKHILEKNCLPTPQRKPIKSQEELEASLLKFNFPLVMKFKDENHINSVNIFINSKQEALDAFYTAQKNSSEVIVEKYINGHHYLFLVVNYKVVSVVKRQILNLSYETNLSVKLEDVTNQVHPSNIFQMERTARLLGFDICDIAVISPDISVPCNQNEAFILEVDPKVNLKVHLSNERDPLKIAAPIFEMLYPENAPSKIPIIAVTGTNGKTTVVRLLSHMLKSEKINVGCTSTEGIYINNQRIREGDCSGPLSAKMILRDPLVEFAVFECARGGILRSGLGFDECDISIITNVSEDHLGLEGIYTLSDMVRVKSVVARSTKKGGYTILNADDDHVYNLRHEVLSQIALFSTSHNNPRVLEHIIQGGPATFLENNTVIFVKDNIQHHIINLAEIPLTFSGQASCMNKNVLPAVLAARLSGLNEEVIHNCLKHFIPNAENLPGRMNLFSFTNYHVLIDYAHNEHAFIELKQYFNNIDCDKKIGIIGATGDRRDIDIIKLGRYSSEIFDEIIIRHDADLRGRTANNMTNLLIQGINQIGDNSKKIQIIPNEFDAIQHAMDTAIPNSYIFYFPDKVMEAVNYVNAAYLKSLEKKNI